jgi:hypothetical protein
MASNATIIDNNHPYKTCNEVTPQCPVSATTLGYYPNPGINYFFAIGFAAALIAIISIGAWKRTWAYASFIAAGCALELAGTLPTCLWSLPFLTQEIRLCFAHPAPHEPVE